jgi:hypothetical protein
MLQLQTWPIVATILEQLGPKLLMDMCDGFNNLGIESFSKMTSKC